MATAGGEREALTPRQSALVGSGSSATEGFRGLFCGVLFGLTSPLIGHPIDTVKTKMQAQATYFKGSAVRTLMNVVKNEGFLALYRGLLPPLVGSAIFRSVQFSVYGATRRAMKDYEVAHVQLPYTGGLTVQVLAAGVVASTARALVESPLEFMKVRLQTGQSWLAGSSAKDALAHPLREVRNLYTGFGITWVRTTGLMTGFFALVDYLERRQQPLLQIPILGPFIKGGVCATLMWVVVWPFENIKNQVQANTAGLPPDASWLQRARFVIQHRGGVLGLYRGIGPGTARSLIANGSSMVVFNFCQECLRD